MASSFPSCLAWVIKACISMGPAMLTVGVVPVTVLVLPHASRSAARADAESPRAPAHLIKSRRLCGANSLPNSFCYWLFMPITPYAGWDKIMHRAAHCGRNLLSDVHMHLP